MAADLPGPRSSSGVAVVVVRGTAVPPGIWWVGSWVPAEDGEVEHPEDHRDVGNDRGKIPTQMVCHPCGPGGGGAAQGADFDEVMPISGGGGEQGNRTAMMSAGRASHPCGQRDHGIAQQVHHDAGHQWAGDQPGDPAEAQKPRGAGLGGRVGESVMARVSARMTGAAMNSSRFHGWLTASKPTM